EKHFSRSRLDEIPGLAKKTAVELLVRFGSSKKIATLTPEELQKVPGIGEKTAKKILEALNS
ncbi:MAG: helix-hairpin-helix domain-containing protein, partial [Synergistales bacterium]|nr:helix-hairpin-helix domain-containing protein [Synergistales bacterium]MDY6433852.1 helix-hairpin-helix domain-containing protein [Synergistales bacterium]